MRGAAAAVCCHSHSQASTGGGNAVRPSRVTATRQAEHRAEVRARALRLAWEGPALLLVRWPLRASRRAWAGLALAASGRVWERRAAGPVGRGAAGAADPG